MQTQHISAAIQAASTPPVATPDQPTHSRVQRCEWRFKAYHPALEPVLPAVQRFCSDVLRNREPYWLTLLGPSGIGKTLALRQALRLLDCGGDGWAIPLNDGKGSERRGTCVHIEPAVDLEDYRAPREYARNFDVVYVEDIGSGVGLDKGSGSVLRSRIAELLQLRTGKWTMLCANMTRAEIEQKLDARIASRLKRDGSVLLQLPSNIPDFNDTEVSRS